MKMMTNMFSSFDPMTKMNISMNWISMIITMAILPWNMWMKKSRKNTIMMKINKVMTKEIKNIFKKNKGFTMMMMSIFMFILTNNIMGMNPYMFTSTSHLLISMSMSMPIWMSIMIFSWKNKTKKMLSHLVPMGTPKMLIPFMILIETTSNIIRPMSLAIRLSANMIAGHIIMNLINTNKKMKMMIMIIISMQMIIMMFEMAVAIIQAYVFTTLTSLYSKEVM